MTDEHWKAEGAFAGTAVLLHGLTSSASTWWQVGPLLAAGGWDVTALDLPGHGDHPRDGEPITASSMVESVADRLPAIGVDLLIGHSMGAVVATGVADTHPELVRALVLEDPPSWRGDPDRDADRVRRSHAAAAADPDAARRRTAADNPTWARTDVDHDVDNLLAADADAVSTGLANHLRGDLLTDLAHVRVPVLLLLAEPARSALHEPERSVIVRALAPERVVDLPAGHCIHRDLPLNWVESVLAFGAAVTS
jgi:pimeloyl-ACP methyl ester carboxylesterase